MYVLKKVFSVAEYVLVLILSVATLPVMAATSLTDIQQRWDETNFILQGDAQIAAFEQLVTDIDAYAEAHSDEAEAWVWSGIIRSSFAGAKGGLGALKLAKAAKQDFEQALERNERAMAGAALSSLGTLYSSVPGWPVGFGNDKKAEEFLRRGLEIDPDGLESNFFYAEYLRDQKRNNEARLHYDLALNAPPRPGRQIADQGRKQAIREILADMGS